LGRDANLPAGDTPWALPAESRHTILARKYQINEELYNGMLEDCLQ
jgi:hypothetical protein